MIGSRADHVPVDRKPLVPRPGKDPEPYRRPGWLETHGLPRWLVAPSAVPRRWDVGFRLGGAAVGAGAALAGVGHGGVMTVVAGSFLGGFVAPVGWWARRRMRGAER